MYSSLILNDTVMWQKFREKLNLEPCCIIILRYLLNALFLICFQLQLNFSVSQKNSADGFLKSEQHDAYLYERQPLKNHWSLFFISNGTSFMDINWRNSFESLCPYTDLDKLWRTSIQTNNSNPKTAQGAKFRDLDVISNW